MVIYWGSPLRPKYLTFAYGSEWRKGEFKQFNFRKVPLGWSMNIWRLSISYDNHGKVSR
jgi:hypothetical protein